MRNEIAGTRPLTSGKVKCQVGQGKVVKETAAVVVEKEEALVLTVAVVVAEKAVALANLAAKVAGTALATKVA